MAIIDDIKNQYRRGSMLMRIIYINIGVFVLLRLAVLVAAVMGFDGQALIHAIAMPAQWGMLLRKPWTVLTYMVTHYELLHILFNMLWLYWLGRIFLEYFTPKQLAGLYILGGIGGATLYSVSMNLLPHFAGQSAYLLGASASILAVVVATAVYAPNYRISLLFIGNVSLKWVAIVTVLIDLLSVEAGNAGGHIAHLGGALVGAAYALMMRRGHDITAGLNALIDGVVALTKRRKPQEPEVKSRAAGSATASEPTEAELDRVLEKIKRSGYSSLSDSDRDVLFGASRKRNV